MTKRNPYFPFYPADFMNGVRGLSAQEVGVYTMLLCRIYEEDGPVEYHVRRLATYCGMREATFEKVVETLVDLGKITLSEGHISNPRAEAEISKRAHGLEIASRAGKISAEKRQQNQRNDATGVQPAFNHTDTDTEKKKEREPNGSPKKTDAVLVREFLTGVLPPETADAFIAHRNKLRKGMTPRAAELIAAKLRKATNPVACVELSIVKGWQDVFPENPAVQHKPAAPAGSDWWGGRDL